MPPSKRFIFRVWRKASHQSHLACMAAVERQGRSLKLRGFRVRLGLLLPPSNPEFAL